MELFLRLLPPMTCSSTEVRTAKGVSLWTESFGFPAGKPLLLIMGAMNPGLFWPRAFCACLGAAGFRVIRFDHRDTGRSSIIDYQKQPYTLSDMTDDVLAILDAHEISRAHIVGMSMGGYIAQSLAAEHPERVHRLVLLSTTADHRPYIAATMGGDASQYDLPPPTPGFLSYVAYAAQHPPANPAEGYQLVLKGWRACHGGSLAFPEADMGALIRESAACTRDPMAAFHHAWAVAASPPRFDLLPRIQAPTLVMHGVADPCLPLPHGRHLAEHIQNARIKTLDMGHMLPPPMSEELAGTIVDFLKDRG